MILANTGTQPRRPLSPDGAAEHAAHAVWLDLLDATEEERSLVERITDLRVPARAELSEIERSSRLAARNGVLTLSTPMISESDGRRPVVTPLGFVLSRDRLLTIRYAPMRTFDSYAEQLYDAGQPPPDSLAVFVGLLEAIVDRLADVLESIGAGLERLSHQIFRPEATGVRRVRRESAILQSTLAEVGRTGEHVSSLRDSLVGISRIVGFVIEVATDWTPPELHSRFTTLRQDIASLNDYDVQITGNVQFLLDAPLGFINIQQNNIIKVLTVASIVGIPPTLVASIYGMNFKAMPELNWAWGYPYGLTLLALSAILPLLWFWRQGWL